MKRIFLDTNFIIDYLIRDDFMSDSEKVMSIGFKKGITFCISYLSVANFAYILRKESKETLDSFIKRICCMFEIIPNNKSQIESSLNLRAQDFEDGLQYMAALESKCDCIITRNKKDFSFSKIPVMTTKEFLESLSSE